MNQRTNDSRRVSYIIERRGSFRRLLNPQGRVLKILSSGPNAYSKFTRSEKDLYRYVKDEIWERQWATLCGDRPAEYVRASKALSSMDEYRDFKYSYLDFKRAYLTCALNLGFISDRTYSELLKVNKLLFNMALGSTASCTYWDHYNDQGIILKHEKVKDALAPNAYRAVSRQVDTDIMTVASHATHGYWLIWVDACYYHRGANRIMVEVARSLGYELSHEAGVARVIPDEIVGRIMKAGDKKYCLPSEYKPRHY